MSGNIARHGGSFLKLLLDSQYFVEVLEEALQLCEVCAKKFVHVRLSYLLLLDECYRGLIDRSNQQACIDQSNL